MSDLPKVISGYFYSNSTGFKKIDLKDWADHNKKRSIFQWVELDAAEDATRIWLTERLKISKLVADSLLAETTRPRIQKISPRCVLVILREMNQQKDNPADMISIRLLIYKTSIVVIRLRKTSSLTKLTKYCPEGRGPKDTGSFIVGLIDQLERDSQKYLQQALVRLEQIEEIILQKPTDDLRDEVTVLRKNNVVFLRYMKPQAEMIFSLEEILDEDWIPEELYPNLVNVKNNALRNNEDLDAIKERAIVIQDEIKNYLAEKQAKNTYALTIVAGIFLPLSFFTGLLGVNLAGIPYAEHHSAFLGFSLLLCVVGLLLILVFRFNDWL